jgi:hypothetical protein
MKKWLLAAVFLVTLPALAWAYQEYQTQGGQAVGAAVLMWINGSSQAVPASASTQLPTQDSAAEGSLSTIASSQGSSATGISQPAGGSGILGWLSGIYKAVTGTLTVATFPGGVTSTEANGTVATGGTYQLVFAASAGRKGCLIQNTSTHTGYAALASGAPSAGSYIGFQVRPNGGTFDCAHGGVVATDNVWYTTPVTGDPLVDAVQ